MRWIVEWKWAGGNVNRVIYLTKEDAEAECERLLTLKMPATLLYVKVYEGTEVM